MEIQLNLFERDRKSMKLGKVNIIYGHSNSGKSFIAQQIDDGFSGKLKKYFLINGESANKSKYEVIHIDTKLNIIDQLKLGAKSYFRKLAFPYINDLVESYEDTDHDFLSKSNECLEKINLKFNSMINDINIKTVNSDLDIRLRIDSINDILSNLFSYSFGEDELEKCSTSTAKELLYSVIYKTAGLSNLETIVILDNFDSDFDEEVTINVINNILNINNDSITFILTTNKPTSLPYLINKANIFSIKENILLTFTDVHRFLNDINSSNVENYTFEEYMINSFVEPINYNKSITLINKNIIYNLGRLLTSKNYIIGDTANEYKNKVVIYPSNNIEKEFYMSIKNYIDKSILSNQ